MKELVKKISVRSIFLFIYTLPFFVFADGSAVSDTGLKNPLKVDSVGGLVTSGMNIVVYIGAIVAVLAIIWVGFMYVKAMGNSDKIKEAHQAFLYTVIGVGILVGAQVITTIITNTINAIK